MNSKELKISCTQPGVTGQEQDEMERELAEDAAWKRIQQNTFTRWANEHLKTVNKAIGNLETDLSDGLRLIALVEVLSGKKLPRYNKRPTFRSQKLENVSVSLLFLQNDEGIKIVNIDSTDIVDCKLKLILGLIWTLILHYSISMPMWEGEDADVLLGEKGGPTPKQRLLGWIQSKLVDLPVQNFTSDWKDGIAVGALVDAVAPGLCPDWPDWSSKNALNNASEAMNLADDWLGVPQLITPEEIVNPNIDELSMMTYLSQYPNAKLKPGAPLRSRINPNRIRCYGPGVESTGVVCGGPTNFTIETFGAGKGDIQVFVENPSGQIEPVEIKFNEDHSMTYTVTYTARLEGLHKVKVTFANKEVPKSPFLVTVEGYAGDSRKVTASGPGLEPSGVMIGRPTYFDVFTKDAGRGQVEVTIVDSHSNKSTIPSRLRKINEDVYRCEYISQVVGSIFVNIFFAGQLIPNSPFGVMVSPVCDARKVRVSGRGIQPRGVRVHDIADFKVFTENAGDGNLEVKVTGSDGDKERVEVNKIDDTTYECIYRPMKEGSFVITISYGGQEVSRSPFEVNVGPYKESKIRAYGPGLIGGVEGYPTCFTVDTNGETGSLGFSIEGPSQAKIECDDNGDGSADVKYFPTVPGDYAVHILCNNEDIPKSPFMAVILPKTDYFPEKVEAYGPGIDKNGVVQKRPVEFTVDTRRAGGHAPLCVNVIDEKYNTVDLNIQDNKDGTYHCNYCPKENNKHTVEVTFGGVAIPGSPYRVMVSEPTDSSKVQVFGPGIESGVTAETPTHFNVDARGCGKGNLQVEISDDRSNLLPHKDLDNGDNTFTVDYIPFKSGNHKIKVQFAEKEVPSSPFYVNVHPKVDVSKIKVDGLEPSAFVDSPVELFVDTQAISKDYDAVVRCTITTPSKACTQSLVQNLSDGMYKISYTPVEEGCHIVDVSYNGVTIPRCPYKINVTKGCDPNKCRAFGPGLKKGVVDEVNVFTVETKQAGTGSLSMAIEGPSEATMTCQDNRDGSCTVEYTPTEPGDYDISVKFADQFIPGSPFKVPVDYDLDASKVRAYGPGVEPEHCRAGLPLQFTVDTKKSAKAPLLVEVQSEYGPVQKKPEIKDKGDGTYDVMYFPSPEHSLCDLRVTYGGQDIAGSPFQMEVKPTYEPEKVKIYGPGVSPKGVPASLPTEFTIDITEAGFAEPEIYLKGPDGRPRKSKLNNKNDGTYTVSYVPDELGQYHISIHYGGQEISNSPFLVNSYPVGQAEKCQITEGKLESLIIGEEHCITVNTEHAGNGAITCQILSISEIRSDVDIEVEDNGDGTFSVYYTLKETGQYTICILFGGQPVPGGVYTVTVVSEEIQERKFVDSFDSVPRSQFLPLEFNTIPVPACEGLTAEVIMPSGKFDKPVVIDNHDGTISLKYDPKEEGSHELQIKYNKDHVPGSPFKFYVDTVSSGYVTAHGTGLTRGIASEPCNFTIYTKGAGAGGLAVAVEGPSKVEINCHDNKDGTVSVSYVPAAPGEYKVTVKFADKHIKGSPFTARITGEGRKRNQISVGHSSEVSLKVQEKDVKSLNASIVAPSGLEEPCFVKKLPNGHLGISFTPRESGKHEVNVKRLGKHITGSPFPINVLENEIADASNVRVSGTALQEGTSHKDNEILIDTKEAGLGGLSFSVEGPSKAEIHCKDNEDGTLKVSYHPSEPGYYIINIKFADHHVKGSPFTVKVTGESSNIQREYIKKQRDAVPVADIGTECKLTVKLPGTSAFDMTAKVSSPSGVTDDAEILDMEDSVYSVHFKPKEVGVHIVSVRYKDIHIPGSPFQFTVGPLLDFGAHRVHAGGIGLERGIAGDPCEFNVWTREAGAGSLAVSVEGPSKAEINFTDRKDGSCYISYKVQEPGDYRVGIKFNDQPIPDSPFSVYILPQSGDTKKIEIGEVTEANLQVNKPVAFTIQMNGAKGMLDGKVVAPSGSEDDCFVAPIDEDQWALRFVPKENGIHQVHIRHNEMHIPQSPFRIRIGQDDADPAAVHADGNGLKECKTGTKTDFIVDTCSAGAGTLAVTIDGPSKVSMDCTEVEEGYKVRYTPLVPGDYYVIIKYNDYHIVGSPFKVHCTGSAVADQGEHETSSVVVETVSKQARQKAENIPKFHSNALKVNSKGMGLKKAYLNKQNTFTVNCGDAGNNLLYVALHGPKGPCEEVYIKHLGRNMYQINYVVKERGDYILFIKYGDDHIPGSPFKVESS